MRAAAAAAVAGTKVASHACLIGLNNAPVHDPDMIKDERSDEHGIDRL